MRRTKWAEKIIPNPRQEREYIERDNKQNFDDKTKKYLSKFDNLVPDYEIYIYFISLYKKILKRNGYLSYGITP